jgi:ATP-dependent DNA helicase HFM1/MER3
MVVAAPTGSGKTVVHELAIMRLLLNGEGRDMKCVFIAPNKALCQQRAAEWSKSFGSMGLM